MSGPREQRIVLMSTIHKLEIRVVRYTVAVLYGHRSDAAGHNSSALKNSNPFTVFQSDSK